ncbi:MAG: hypothetical protein IPK54_10690 [Dokdonella sp.]|uniref:hypothetical protein n=1 Tax=Dokdonella sp. TaxID=2291710 RepID=UPI0025BB0001|nr:hypothetical protein [Dokdonella sp.]MBK8123998.1 hypothetical protein [Dokdonella sp.]
MGVEVVTEAECLGDIIGDVSRRRGTVSEQGQKGPQTFVQGQVPLAEMFRLHQLPALSHTRSRHLHHGIRQPRRSAEQPGREADGERIQVGFNALLNRQSIASQRLRTAPAVAGVVIPAHEIPGEPPRRVFGPCARIRT